MWGEERREGSCEARRRGGWRLSLLAELLDAEGRAASEEELVEIEHELERHHVEHQIGDREGAHEVDVAAEAEDDGEADADQLPPSAIECNHQHATSIQSAFGEDDGTPMRTSCHVAEVHGKANRASGERLGIVEDGDSGGGAPLRVPSLGRTSIEDGLAEAIRSRQKPSEAGEGNRRQ